MVAFVVADLVIVVVVNLVVVVVEAVVPFVSYKCVLMIVINYCN